MNFKAWFNKITEADAIFTSKAKPNPDYQVWGAQSDLKKQKKNAKKHSKKK